MGNSVAKPTKFCKRPFENLSSYDLVEVFLFLDRLQLERLQIVSRYFDYFIVSSVLPRARRCIEEVTIDHFVETRLIRRDRRIFLWSIRLPNQNILRQTTALDDMTRCLEPIFRYSGGGFH